MCPISVGRDPTIELLPSYEKYNGSQILTTQPNREKLIISSVFADKLYYRNILLKFIVVNDARFPISDGSEPVSLLLSAWKNMKHTKLVNISTLNV